MDFDAFRDAVDACPNQITPVLGKLDELYRYVGLPGYVCPIAQRG
jgi:hypothetical protein